MSTYIRLVRFTERGVQSVRKTPDLIAQARKVFERNGGRIVQVWTTLGQYDVIAIVEAPDDRTMAKISALVAAQGNFTAETLPAVPVPEFAESLK